MPFSSQRRRPSADAANGSRGVPFESWSPATSDQQTTPGPDPRADA
ncbi:MAG: hypothetical protein AVDCRST_MAG49-4601 [uncultured Thermomicrobiales bacterium]|uniref:Uncharacterized protein n=1 Tax=uncultured Thermomicrobiales bacterium TaxID=1645740 RepID=A0A6J4VIP2_9BACT|nr:MAG: hypothetical protein AVDCRST_MAG49-4601 [uncultured Thermomicrobiales bacterium]